MAKENNLVIIDADSMMYIIGSELEHLQLEPLGILKLDEFLSDILIATGSKEYLGFVGGGGGVNFRKSIAVTKEYKGNRAKEKPEWFQYWQPILAERMVNHWGFQYCANIEADDACAIAKKKYHGHYEKITIATPDKDLFQIGDAWFYDYTKRVTVFCDKEVALLKLCHQLITGDSTDNIPGCQGAGKVVANEIVHQIMKEGLNEQEALLRVRDFYVAWYTEELRKKQTIKQEKDYLIKYKEENSISKLTAALKSKALQGFKVNTSMILKQEQAVDLFIEQLMLVRLLNSEEEAAKHGFILSPPTLNTSIDWDSIEIFHEEMEILQLEEDKFDFDDLL